MTRDVNQLPVSPTSAQNDNRFNLVVVSLPYADWSARPRLRGELDKVAQSLELSCDILIVNDAGTPAVTGLVGLIATISTLDLRDITWARADAVAGALHLPPVR